VNKDGTFKAVGVPVGEVQVGLAYEPLEADAALDRMARARLQAQDGKGPDGKFDPKMPRPENREARPDTFKNPIPELLRDPRSSGKTITVQAGKANVLTWDVRP
jgi:hypothetical protein